MDEKIKEKIIKAAKYAKTAQQQNIQVAKFELEALQVITLFEAGLDRLTLGRVYPWSSGITLLQHPGYVKSEKSLYIKYTTIAIHDVLTKFRSTGLSFWQAGGAFRNIEIAINESVIISEVDFKEIINYQGEVLAKRIFLDGTYKDLFNSFVKEMVSNGPKPLHLIDLCNEIKEISNV